MNIGETIKTEIYCYFYYNGSEIIIMFNIIAMDYELIYDKHIKHFLCTVRNIYLH